MASKLSEPSTAIVGYIRLNPPTSAQQHERHDEPGRQRQEEQRADDDRADDREYCRSVRRCATTSPTISTINIGMIGADRNDRNLFIENASAWRMEIFSSRATCTAAMREIAPPKIDQIVRKYSPKMVKKTRMCPIAQSGPHMKKRTSTLAHARLRRSKFPVAPYADNSR